MVAADRSPLRRLVLALGGGAGCAVALVALVWLAYDAPPVERLDMRLLNRLVVVGEGGLAVRWGRHLVHLGDPAAVLTITAVASLAAILAGRWRQALAAAALLAGASATTLALKDLLAHARPDPALDSHQIVVNALPSGHSTALAALALAIALAAPQRWRPPVIALAGGVALLGSLSLVLLGDHFPSDVLAGWLVAAGWLFAVLAGLRAEELLRLSAAGRSRAQAGPTANTLSR
jgi:undecaprenyl-diphosphatase